MIFFEKWCKNFEMKRQGGSPLSAPEGGPTLGRARVRSHSELDKARNNKRLFCFLEVKYLHKRVSGLEI
jgi:hypothetical protein